MKKFESLKKSEIKKAEALATKLNGKKTQVTAWGAMEQSDIDKETGFISVKCEMCSEDMSVRENDIIIAVCLWDRRRSFVQEAWF